VTTAACSVTSRPTLSSTCPRAPPPTPHNRSRSDRRCCSCTATSTRAGAGRITGCPFLPCRFPLLRPQPPHIGVWTFTLTKVDRLRVERTKAVVVETTRETTGVAVQVAAESGSRNVEYFFLSVVAQAV
jgi:hypothetical protein